jgi:hypothetical protein
VEIRDKTNPSTLETLREFVASHRLAITAVTAIAIGAMVGWWYSESDALQRRVRGELTSLDMFRGEEQGPLAAWLGADADVLATRNSLLQVWNWVRRVAKQDRQIADAVSVFRDSEVEELGQLTPDLQALFARDMKDAVLRSAAHAIVAHPGTGAGPYTGALAQLRDLGTVFAAIPAAHSVFSDSTAALGGADGALPELFLRIPALVNEGKAGFLEDVQGVPGSSPERELFLQELRRRVLSALWERALRASGGATEDFETLCLSVFQGLSHKMFAGIEPQSADIRDPIARVIWEAAGSLGQGTTGRR